jgi:hypothetical protein
MRTPPPSSARWPVRPPCWTRSSEAPRKEFSTNVTGWHGLLDGASRRPSHWVAFSRVKRRPCDNAAVALNLAGWKMGSDGAPVPGGHGGVPSPLVHGVSASWGTSQLWCKPVARVALWRVRVRGPGPLAGSASCPPGLPRTLGSLPVSSPGPRGPGRPAGAGAPWAGPPRQVTVPGRSSAGPAGARPGPHDLELAFARQCHSPRHSGH